jgi:hypothetical protein
MGRNNYGLSFLEKVVALGSVDDLDSALGNWAKDYEMAKPCEGKKGVIAKAWRGIRLLGQDNQDELDNAARGACWRAVSRGDAGARLSLILGAMQASLVLDVDQWKALRRSLAARSGDVGRLDSLEVVAAQAADEKELLSMLSVASKKARKSSHDRCADQVDARRRAVIDELRISAAIKASAAVAKSSGSTPRL